MAGKYRAYSEYRKTHLGWLNQIPNHWDVKRLKYLGDALIGLTYSPDDVVDEGAGTLVLRSSNVQNKQLAFEDNVYVNKVIPEKLLTQKGDILICARNGSRALIGKNAQINQDAVGMSFGAFMSVFRSPYNNYLSKVFNSALFEYQSGSFLTATINQLTTGNLNSFEIPLPPAIEQQQIIKFLDHQTAKIDTLIDKQQQLITLLKEKRQAVISHAVTKGLNLDAPMRDSGVEWLGEVPAHWVVTRVKNVVTRIVDGPHFSPKYVDDGYMFISARNIKVDGWSLDDAKYVSEADFLEFNKRVTPEIGDVLLTKGGTTGIARAVDLEFPFQVWVHVAVLKTIQSKMDPFYFTYVLNGTACYEQSQQYTYGATNNDLGLGRIAKIFFAQPSLEEQQKMRLWLDEKCRAFDALIAKGNESIELMQVRRTALISAAVTGKIDVRQPA
tara:strand:- start:115209 stop:116534 length:1326 start_codon:yes stop_codon:yes gene_type:complete